VKFSHGREIYFIFKKIALNSLERKKGVCLSVAVEMMIGTNHSPHGTGMEKVRR